MRKTLTIATLAATCAALAIAPSAAMGKTVKFAGPVDQVYIPSTNGFSTTPPAIEMKITITGKKPKAVVGGTLKAEGLYGPCTLGSYGCNGICQPGAGCLPEAPQCFGLGTKFGEQIKVKNKRFSGSYSDLFTEDPANNFFKVTGRVTKKSVTGTVHARTYEAAREPDAAGNGGHAAAECDTGILTYKATK